MTSIVRQPASVSFKLEKVDHKARTVTGWAAIVTGDDGQPIIDQDDPPMQIPVAVLKRAVQDAFARQSGTKAVGINHEVSERGSADLVESIVITKELREAFELGTSGREGWIATVRVTDPKVLDRVESGELAELSLKGEARGRWSGEVGKQHLLISSMDLDTAELLSLVDRGASGDKNNRPQILLFKRKEEQRMKDGKKPGVGAWLKAFIAKKDESVQTEKTGMTPEQIKAALDELGLDDKQMEAILQLMQALAGAAPAAAAPAPEVEKPVEQVGDAISPEEEEQQMQKKGKDKEVETDVEKRELLKRVERLEESNVSLEKRNKALEDAAEDVKLRKRAKELEFLPMAEDDIVELLKRSKGDDKFDELLVKMSKAIEESPALEVLGSAIQDPEKSAVAKRDKLVAEEIVDLQKKGQKATYEIAFKNVCKRHPELYDAEKIDASQR